MIKEIFIDSNPILLGITAVVSVTHTILEALAFGSDIAHYRKKKDDIGISVRSILANVFMQFWRKVRPYDLFTISIKTVSQNAIPTVGSLASIQKDGLKITMAVVY
ncbi:cleft lip and palate transmembrane protein 1 domain-containing protein, partial [Trichoderma camerunense]